MNLREWVIGGILFSMMLLGLFVFGGGLASEYDIDVEDNYNDTYNEIASYATELESLQAGLEPSDPEDLGQGDSALGFMARGGWSVIRMTLRIPTTMRTFMIDFSEEYAIPLWASYGLLAIVVALIFFAIAGAVLRSPNL